MVIKEDQLSKLKQIYRVYMLVIHLQTYAQLTLLFVFSVRFLVFMLFLLFSAAFLLDAENAEKPS